MSFSKRDRKSKKNKKSSAPLPAPSDSSVEDASLDNLTEVKPKGK